MLGLVIRVGGLKVVMGGWEVVKRGPPNRGSRGRSREVTKKKTSQGARCGGGHLDKSGCWSGRIKKGRPGERKKKEKGETL